MNDDTPGDVVSHVNLKKNKSIFSTVLLVLCSLIFPPLIVIRILNRRALHSGASWFIRIVAIIINFLLVLALLGFVVWAVFFAEWPRSVLHIVILILTGITEIALLWYLAQLLNWFVVLIGLVLIIGFPTWLYCTLPPYYLQIRFYHFWYASELQRNVEKFLKDPHLQKIGFNATCGKDQVHIQRRGKSECSKQTDDHLPGALIWRVKDTGDIVFHIGAIEKHDRSFEFSLVYSEGSPIHRCLERFWLTPQGNCDIALDAHWSIGYLWSHSHDFSQQDLMKIIQEKELKDLSCLLLDNTQVTDLSPLLSLRKLKHLFLASDTPIRNLAPLAKIRSLETLSIRRSISSDSKIERVWNLSVLSNLPQLKYLRLAGTKITEFSSIRNLINLEVLNLSDTGITDLSFLSDLTNLTELRIAGVKATDFSSLRNLTNLEVLDLSGTKITTDLSLLPRMTRLKKLYLGGTFISDLSLLSRLKNLQELSLYDTPIRDPSPLTENKDLEVLHLSRTLIEDFGFLSGLTKLRELNLSGTAIRDLTPLSQLKNLEKLDISRTNACDLSPLSNLDWMQRIYKRGRMCH